MISGASRGACRNGRYANRSISKAMPTEEITPPISISGSTHSDVVPLGTSSQTVSAPNAPIMKISPWAKLINWMMP